MKSMGRRTYLISLGISILFTLFILSGQWSGAEGLSKGYYAAQGIACLLLFLPGRWGSFGSGIALGGNFGQKTDRILWKSGGSV